MHTDEHGSPARGGLAEFPYYLGKKTPLQYYHEVGVKLASFTSVTPALPADVPATWAFGSHIYYTMMKNDELGDCTIAACGHGEHTWSTRTGKTELPDDGIILEMYYRSGQRQGLSNTDGRWMAGNGVGVLDLWKNEGMLQKDGSLEKIYGYAAVDPGDRNEVIAGGYWLGGLSVGIALPASALYQWSEAQRTGKRCVWSMDPRLHDETVNPGSWTPGTWGGHEVWISSINKHGPVAVSWAERVQMTWSWWNHYVDEAYVVLSPDWIRKSDLKSPTGLDLDRLLDKLEAI